MRSRKEELYIIYLEFIKIYFFIDQVPGEQKFIKNEYAWQLYCLLIYVYTSYILERNMYAWIQSLFQMKK